VFAAAVAQIVASQFSRLTGLGIPIEDLPQPYISPEEPEGYAFVIWALIFALALAYSAKQVLPDPNNEKLFREIRPSSAFLFGISSAWMISAQLWGNGFNLVAIIIVMLVASIYLLKAVSEARDKNTFNRWVIDPLFGLFAGWLTLAAFLNAGSAVRDMFGTFGLSPVAFAVAILLPAGFAALSITALTRGSWWYSGAVIWGLVAVIATNIGTTASVEIIALSAGLIVAVSACTLGVRGVGYRNSRYSFDRP
jgi:hypothetical protein